MCRLLFKSSNEEFSIPEVLEKFAYICRHSKEFQGHGWGFSYLKVNDWVHYKNIKPIWEDDFSQFGKTKRLTAHARSAFRDRDITLENNMPFYDDEYIFTFNGELQGVKIKEEGRIGAEKIFNYIKRFDKGNFSEAFDKGIEVINKRTTYIKAMNIIIADKNKVWLSSQFNEEEDYFKMYYKKNNSEFIICSDPLDDNKWEEINNNTITEFNE